MKRYICAILIVIVAIPAWSITTVRRKYGVQTTIHFAVYDTNSPWALYETAPAAGDVFIVKNGKAETATTNNAVDIGKTHEITLTATEMAAAELMLVIQDQSSPALFGDEVILIDVYGDANAAEQFDTSDASPTVDSIAVDGNELTADHLHHFFGNVGAGDPYEQFEDMYDGTGYAGGTIKLESDLQEIDDEDISTWIIDANDHFKCQIEYISNGSNAFNASTDTVNLSSATETQIDNIETDTAAQDSEAEWADLASTVVDNIILAIDANSTTNNVLLAGTASAGSSTTITLTGGAATAGLYDGCLCVIKSGTGAGQARTILSYAADTVATVTRNWVTAPAADSVFRVYGADVPALLEAGTATAGAAGSITFDTGAPVTVDIYKNNFVMITAGTGAGQCRLISAYSAGRVASVLPNWTVTPDNTSVYQVKPTGRVDVAGVSGTVQTAGDLYSYLTTNLGSLGANATEVGGTGDHLTAINLPNQTMDITGNITGNLSGSVGSLTGHTVQTGDTYALAAGATGFAAIDTVVDTILADSNELQTDWANGGRLDTLLDAAAVGAGGTPEILSTTVASVTSARQFTLTATGVATDNRYNELAITVTDVDGDNVEEIGVIYKWTASTKTVRLFSNLSFTPAVGDTVKIYPTNPLILSIYRDLKGAF